MISRERRHDFLRVRKRRLKLVRMPGPKWKARGMEMHNDLGLRACSCSMCDPHKWEPNKQRRAREREQWRNEAME